VTDNTHNTGNVTRHFDRAAAFCRAERDAGTDPAFNSICPVRSVKTLMAVEAVSAWQVDTATASCR
jgi:hypothetical protein